MKRILLITAMVIAAGLSLTIGGASQALQTNLISNTATGDGGVVVIEILGQGTAIAQPGYALLFSYSVAPNTGGATASINYVGFGDPYNGTDPNFDFGSPAVCNLNNPDCQGANGGHLAKARPLTDSFSTFTVTGLAPGTVVDWNTANSTLVGGPSGQFTVIPEPTTAALLGLGLFGLVLGGRRRS